MNNKSYANLALVYGNGPRQPQWNLGSCYMTSDGFEDEFLCCDRAKGSRGKLHLGKTLNHIRLEVRAGETTKITTPTSTKNKQTTTVENVHIL